MFPILKNSIILKIMEEVNIPLTEMELTEPGRCKERVREVFVHLVSVRLPIIGMRFVFVVGGGGAFSFQYFVIVRYIIIPSNTFHASCNIIINNNIIILLLLHTHTHTSSASAGENPKHNSFPSPPESRPSKPVSLIPNSIMIPSVK